MMIDLVLHVKKEYFEAIRDGRKHFEYRQCTLYWKKRLLGHDFSGIQVHCGYPKSGDASRIVRRKWVGFSEKTIIHRHFGSVPTKVFSIDVSELL